MTQTLLTRDDLEGCASFDSIAWAYEVHLKEPDYKEYDIAILYGNEDAPAKIEFFNSDHPRTPVFVWTPLEESK